jgi:hypothetical protein
MIRKTALALALATAAVAPAAAEPATLLGVFQNWSAFSSGSGAGTTCYALSKPTAKRPATAKRGDVYLMISDWPERKVKAEPQIVLGYAVKENAPAALSIGTAKFNFFARGAGNDGSAWLQALGENARLVEVMSKGVSAVALGTSSRATKTSDTYSLAGFNDALAKIHDVCKM